MAIWLPWKVMRSVWGAVPTAGRFTSAIGVKVELQVFQSWNLIRRSAGVGPSGRVDPSTGARYVANIYPEGSPLGPTPALRLIKFHDWNTWSSTFTPMALVNLPAVGTAPHTLRMTFQGNQIAIYFDGNQIVNMADNNVDGLPPYLHGAFGAHMYMDAPHLATFDDLYVTSLVVNATNTAPTLSAQADRTIAALTTMTVTNTATDSDIPAQTLTYQLIGAPAGASINANGIISWTPTSSQAPSTNLITTVVTDNGTPPLSATNRFSVVVTSGNSARSEEHTSELQSRLHLV